MVFLLKITIIINQNYSQTAPLVDKYCEEIKIKRLKGLLNQMSEKRENTEI